MFWHEQHNTGWNKISFDFQIPVDLEVYGAMLLHAALNPLVKRTFDNLQTSKRRPGSFQTNSDSINAYLVIGSPAIDAYRLLVREDRRSSIGLYKKKQNATAEDEIQTEPEGQSQATTQAYNRRWITALRLYCAIDGQLPHLAQGKWKEYVMHYKMKVHIPATIYRIICMIIVSFKASTAKR